MPLAPYTLDNGFKESKIKVLNPRLPEENYDQIPLNTRKRRLFDHAAEGENQRKENENRPPKKTRFDIKERTVAWVDSASASKPSVTDSDPVKPAHTTATSVHGPLIDLTRIQASTKNAALSSRKFESQIQITTLSPPPTPPKPAKTLERSTRLHPNVVYWNELLAKSCAQNTASLKLDIADILRAPAAEAAIFRVDESYCGHKFINKDYQ